MQKHKLDGRFTIRLDPRTDKALFEFARRKGIKRADLIRELLDNFEPAYTLLKRYQEQEQTRLDGDVSSLLLERFPEVPPEVFEQLAEVLLRATERRRAEILSGLPDKK